MRPESTLKPMLTEIRTALAFLTLLRVGPKEISSLSLVRSAAFFPLAGWVIGLMLISVTLLLLAAGLDALPVAVLLVGLEAWLTRGLHLDGVADLLDGSGGSFDRIRRLAIMKDSAIGAFGVVGLVVTLGLKIAALSALLGHFSLEAGAPFIKLILLLISVPTISRWSMVTLAWKSHYPREAGTGHVFVGQVSGREIVIGFILLIPFFFLGWPCWIVFAVCQLPALWLWFHAHRLFGGVTGDVLGASCEFSEGLGWLAASSVVSFL